MYGATALPTTFYVRLHVARAQVPQVLQTLAQHAVPLRSHHLLQATDDVATQVLVLLTETMREDALRVVLQDVLAQLGAEQVFQCLALEDFKQPGTAGLLSAA